MVNRISIILGSALSLCFCNTVESNTLNHQRFYCGEVDQLHQSKLATLVRTRRGSIPFIFWESNYSQQLGLTSKENCETVALNLQRSYDRQQLRFMATGSFNNSPAICIAQAKTDNPCTKETVILQLPPDVDPLDALDSLVNINRAASGNTLRLYDEIFTYHDREAYLDVELFLEELSELETATTDYVEFTE